MNLTQDATELSLRSTAFRPASPRPKVKIFIDDNVGAWRLTLVPLSESAVSNLRLQHRKGLIELEESQLGKDVDLREVEMAWIQEHQSELSQRHPGEWIAVDGDVLVGHSRELPDAIAQATAAGHSHPFITLVPAGDDAPFYG